MTIDEVTLDRPKVSTTFSVICRFCRLGLFRFALTFSTEISTPLQVVPALEWVRRIRSLFLTTFLFHRRMGKRNSSSFWLINTSFALILRWYISDASINFQIFQDSYQNISFPNSAISSYPRKIPGSTFLSMNSHLIFLWRRMIFNHSSNGSSSRLSCDVFSVWQKVLDISKITTARHRIWPPLFI